MARLRWTNPPREADPGRAVRSSEAVLVLPDTDKNGKRIRSKGIQKPKLLSLIDSLTLKKRHLQMSRERANVIRKIAKLGAEGDAEAIQKLHARHDELNTKMAEVAAEFLRRWPRPTP